MSPVRAPRRCTGCWRPGWWTRWSSLRSPAFFPSWPSCGPVFRYVPLVAYAPFRPDDGELLLACRESVSAVAVEGVDDPIVGDLVVRASITAERRRALAEAPRVLRLTEPLQRSAWNVLLGEVERPIRTTALAQRLQISREHLSRQFGAGGAPNLKRVIDLTRVACAAQLLGNPGYSVPTVVRVLHFASPSHLANTARRIASVSSSGLGRPGAARCARCVRAGEYAESGVSGAAGRRASLTLTMTCVCLHPRPRCPSAVPASLPLAAPRAL